MPLRRTGMQRKEAIVSGGIVTVGAIKPKFNSADSVGSSSSYAWDS